MVTNNLNSVLTNTSFILTIFLFFSLTDARRMSTSAYENWLGECINELYQMDFNAGIDGENFNLDKQASAHRGKDNARRPLFSSLDDELISRPTYRTFIDLLDNYVSETGAREVVTRQEKTENIEFINEICETELMKKAYDFAVQKSLFKGSYGVDFKRVLYSIWFKLYARSYKTSRKGISDSSAFEHTFVGETKKSGPIGFHNWVRFYLLEKSGELDYQGHVRRSERSAMMQVQFEWEGDAKKSSFFIGTSPEFEIAVYTLAALTVPKVQKESLHYKFEVDGEKYGLQLYVATKDLGSGDATKFRLQTIYPTAEW